MAIDRRDLSALALSAGLVLVGRLLSTFSKLAERIIIGRAFSPGTYGEVSIALAILSFAVTISLVGFNQGVPRYVARFDDGRDIRGTWFVGMVLAGGMSVLLALAIVLNGGFLRRTLLDGAVSPALLVVFAAAIPFVVGLRVAIGGIRGLENTRYKVIANDVLYPGLRIAVLVVLLSLGVGVLAPAYAYLVAAAVAVVVAHLLLNRLVRLVGAVRTHSRELVAFSVPLVLSSIFADLLTYTDTVMLGFFRPSYQVGLYSAAYPLATSLLVVLSSFGYLYLPLASRLDAQDKRGEVADIYQLSSKWTFILTFPAFLALLAFPGDVLTIAFSAEYRPAAAALTILTVGFFTNAAVGRNRETLSALGYSRGVLLSNAVAFAANVVLNLALIPRYGFVGAAAASATSFVMFNAVVYAILRRRYDITPFSRYTRRTFVVLPAVLIPVTLGLARVMTLDLVTLVGFLVVAGVATLVLVAASGCLQPEDRVAIQLVEERLGVTVPFIRRYLPE